MVMRKKKKKAISSLLRYDNVIVCQRKNATNKSKNLTGKLKVCTLWLEQPIRDVVHNCIHNLLKLLKRESAVPGSKFLQVASYVIHPFWSTPCFLVHLIYHPLKMRRSEKIVKTCGSDTPGI